MFDPRAFAVLCSILVFASGFAFAETTSRLRVTVENHEGNPLEGASVRIEAPALIGGARTGATDAGGEFTFNLLPQGTFTVAAQIDGFETSETTVALRLGRTASVRFKLTPVVFEGEVEIEAEVPVIDVTQTNASQVFERHYLDRAAVGMDGRNYVSITEHAPTVVEGRRVAGSSGSENAYVIDGLNFTSGGTGWGGRAIVFDAIEEISVLTAGYEAEFSYVTGGVTNLVTKSGSNRFSGTLDVRFRSEALNDEGDFYDPGYDASSRRDVAATLGGPILRDRVWFFAAFADSREEETPTGALIAREGTEQSFMAKVTWAPNAQHRFSLLYLDDPGTTYNQGINSITLPEATIQIRSSNPRIQMELNSVLNDSLFLTVAGGIDRSDFSALPQNGDLETPSEYDVNTPLRYSNSPYAEAADTARDHFRGVLSAFAGDLAGSHQIGFGGDYHRLQTEENDFIPGGYILNYLNNSFWADDPWPDGDGDGLVDYYLERNYPSGADRGFLNSKVEGWGIFAQDEWRPTSSLTVSAGIRYDSMAHTNTVGDTIADFEKWQPRVGLAWDIGARGKHVFRASWGRFTHPGVTNLGWEVPGLPRGYEILYGLDFMCGYWAVCDRETARAILGDESEFVHIDAEGDEHPYYLYGRYTSPADTVDTLGVGRLRVPYQDQFLVAYEAQIAREASIEISYLDTTYGDLIENTCRNNTWAWADGEPPSLDDPSTWTDESGCTGTVRANLPGLERNYRAAVLRLESRAPAWLRLVGSYTYSKSTGNIHNSEPYTGFGSWFGAIGLEYDRYPTNFLNLDGNHRWDYRHSVKLNGFILLPHDFAVGFAGYYRSAPAYHVATTCSALLNPNPGGLEELERLGIDYQQTVAYCQSVSSGRYVLEPAGSRRGEDLWQLDLDLSKAFTIGPVTLQAIVTVLNVFSNEAPTGWTSNPFDSRGWGTPIQYQQPRRYELGFRVGF